MTASMAMVPAALLPVNLKKPPVPEQEVSFTPHYQVPGQGFLVKK
jgi:hypothetical protein